MKEKLKGIEAFATSKGKKIKTRYVVADLAKATKYEEYAKMAEKIRDIDVAMLFLNAGWACMGPFKDLTPQEIEETVTINALHPVYLSKALLDQMLAREKRSAIVVTSSGLGSAPIPGILAYSMSKSFSSFLAEGLNVELKNKVDVLSF